jgi:hypothetical protein
MLPEGARQAACALSRVRPRAGPRQRESAPPLRGAALQPHARMLIDAYPELMTELVPTSDSVRRRLPRWDPRLWSGLRCLLAVLVSIGCTPRARRGGLSTPAVSAKPVQSKAGIPAPAGLKVNYDEVSPKCALVCRDFGMCWYETSFKHCVAASKLRCRESRMCKTQGRCDTGGPLGECIATSNEDCRASENCARNGGCWAAADGGWCDTTSK